MKTRTARKPSTITRPAASPLHEEAQLHVRAYTSASRRVLERQMQCDMAPSTAAEAALTLAEIDKSDAENKAVAAILALSGQVDAIGIRDGFSLLDGDPAEFVTDGHVYRVEGSPLRLATRPA